MDFVSKYTAKQPDNTGHIAFSDEENNIWAILYERQMKIIVDRACPEFCLGLTKLDMPQHTIPQCEEINRRLYPASGWRVKPVAALIPEEEYFDLLANCYFPAASFIRLREELDYLQEPDIFHELYGHCPMLANQAFADFQQAYGKLALKASPIDRLHLMRLYWFTVEFGLIQTQAGLRVYGGGILSSAKETVSSLVDPTAIRIPFDDGLTALRTPYRIDMVQPVYFILADFQQLYKVLQGDLMGLVHQAQDLGDLPPHFPPVNTSQLDIKC